MKFRIVKYESYILHLFDNRKFLKYFLTIVGWYLSWFSYLLGKSQYFFKKILNQQEKEKCQIRTAYTARIWQPEVKGKRKHRIWVKFEIYPIVSCSFLSDRTGLDNGNEGAFLQNLPAISKNLGKKHFLISLISRSQNFSLIIFFHIL